MNRLQSFRRYVARTAIASVLVVAAGVFGFQGPSSTPVADALAAPYGAGGEYHAITPIRILDTREANNDVAPGGKKPTSPSGTEFQIPALGRGTMPKFVDANGDKLDDNVLALAVNVTIDQPTSYGQVQLYAAGANDGGASLNNYNPGETIPNFAIVRVGTDGKLAAKIVSGDVGSAHLIIDVFGYFTTSNAPERGARINTITPGRVFDSRDAGSTGPIGAMGQQRIPIRGAVNKDTGERLVPNDPSVVGAIVNITAVDNSTYTYVSATPTRTPPNVKPGTSNLNLRPNDMRAATAIVPVGPDGSIYLFQDSGTSNLLVDVLGYLQTGAPETTTAGRLVPLVRPFRAGDSRKAEHFSHPVGPGQAEDWSFENFINDVKIDGQWVGAQQGFIANFTATNLKRQYSTVPVSSYLTLSPPPANGVGGVPQTSSVNFFERQDVPNMVITRYGSNPADSRCASAQCLRVYNSAGYVDYIFDISAVILA